MKRSLLTVNITCGPDTAAILERLTAMAGDTQDRLDQLTATLNGVADRLTTGLDGVRGDLQALKDANPAVDFTALDASVARLSGEADALSALDTETPAADPQA